MHRLPLGMGTRSPNHHAGVDLAFIAKAGARKLVSGTEIWIYPRNSSDGLDHLESLPTTIVSMAKTRSEHTITSQLHTAILQGQWLLYDFERPSAKVMAKAMTHVRGGRPTRAC